MWFWILSNPVIEKEVKNFHLPRPAASFARLTPLRGVCRRRRHAGRVSHRDREKSTAFRFGTVVNQQM
jgi:hypothetical protein